MLGHVFINDLILVGVLAICLYTDLKERKIYNKVVFSAMAIGLVYSGLVQGWEGFLFSLKGLGAGLALLLVPFIFGGFGAGDVKLLGAIGALKGPEFVWVAFIFTGLAGGVVAVAFLLYQGKLFKTLKRVFLSLYILLGSKLKINTLNTLDKTEFHEAFPYGIAIVAGTVATYLVG